uniref:SANTA domain-containing protein n=1 Tax=Leersia perrieri TaxID=77586 RepID=A0A0D9W3L4_9ORYZ
MLSPSSAAPLPFPTDDSEEHPCVELFGWWLERVEGDDRKVRVAGHMKRNCIPDVFTSAPIVKRHEACTLEAEDGVILLIDGPLDLSQMEKNGYSIEVCENFMIGFPYCWEESCNLGSQPSCSGNSNSHDGSNKIYLELFQLGNFADKAASSFLANLLRSSSGDDADSFEKGSNLSNKTPRFEEYTCDVDISAKEKTTAFTEGSKGSPAVCNKVGNGKIDLIMEGDSQERGYGDIDRNASLTSMEQFTVEKAPKEAGNQNEFIHPDAKDQEASSHLVNSDLIYNMSTDKMPCEMEDGSANAGSSVGQGSKEILSIVPSERENFSMDSCLDNIPPKNTCVEHQACLDLQIAQHMTVNKEIVPNEDMSTSVHSDVESLGNPVGPAKEQRAEYDVFQDAPRSPKQHVGSTQEQTPEPYMVQGANRSPMIRTPIPHGHCSPLTLAKAKSLSLSTPESLNLRRTRSGWFGYSRGWFRVAVTSEREQVKDSFKEEKGLLIIFQSIYIAWSGIVLASAEWRIMEKRCTPAHVCVLSVVYLKRN